VGFAGCDLLSVVSEPWLKPLSGIVQELVKSGDGMVVDEEEQRPARSRLGAAARSTGGWIVLLVVGLSAAFLLRTFVAEPFFIPSPSMQPALRPGDRVIVDKLRYRFADPRRGDVVVFDKPANAGGSAEVRNLIKRVIAVPGDEIEARQGVVYRNGQVLGEPYLRPGTVTTDITRQQIPPDRYWVMGDNREVSEDSRLFGPVPSSVLTGRAVIRVWPASDIGWVRG
jgi:signal peptidase I